MYLKKTTDYQAFNIYNQVYKLFKAQGLDDTRVNVKSADELGTLAESLRSAVSRFQLT